jgi:hypothetical protein
MFKYPITFHIFPLQNIITLWPWWTDIHIGYLQHFELGFLMAILKPKIVRFELKDLDLL